MLSVSWSWSSSVVLSSWCLGAATYSAPAPRPVKLEAVSRSLSAPLGGGMSARCSGQVVASARFGGCGYLYGSIMYSRSVIVVRK